MTLPRGLARIEGLRAAPAHCGRLPSSLGKERACDGGGALAALAGALEVSDAVKRDVALAQLEGCASLAPPLVRALRADLFRECADVLVGSALHDLKEPVAAELGDVLLALALAARYERALSKPAGYAGDGSAVSIEQYFKLVLRPWRERELAKVSALDTQTGSLTPEGYGAVVLTLAQARANRELFRAGRGVDVPVALKKDYELRTRFYAALEQELMGLRSRSELFDEQAAAVLAIEGVHRGSDADLWFEAQSDFFGKLRLMPPPWREPESVQERIAAKVPMFYADMLFGVEFVTDLPMLRVMVESGLSQRARWAFALEKLDAEQAEVIAYFRATLAQRTRDATQWDEAIALLAPLPRRSPAAELTLATARAARSGPRQFSARRPARVDFDIRPLEAFARADGDARLRAFAAHNAAWLALLENTAASTAAAFSLMNRARELSPDDGCLRSFENGWLGGSASKACELPRLP